MRAEDVRVLVVRKVTQALLELPGFPVPRLSYEEKIFANFLALRYARAGTQLTHIVTEDRQFPLFRFLLAGLKWAVEVEGETWRSAGRLRLGLEKAGLPRSIMAPPQEELAESKLFPEAFSAFWQNWGPQVVLLAISGDSWAQELTQYPPYLQTPGGWIDPEGAKKALAEARNKPGPKARKDIRLALDILEAAPFPRPGEDEPLVDVALRYLASVRSGLIGS